MAIYKTSYAILSKTSKLSSKGSIFTPSEQLQKNSNSWCLEKKNRSLKSNLIVKRESAKIDHHCLKNEKYLNDLCRVINYKHVLDCIRKYLTLEKVKLLRPDFTNSQCNYVTQKLYIKTLLKKMPLTLNFFSWITRFQLIGNIYSSYLQKRTCQLIAQTQNL